MSEKGDLISRETLGVGRCNPDVMLDPAYAAGWNALLNIINNAPAVDAAPVVHGRWIEKSYLLGTTRYCSECGENYGMPHGVFNYCPHCGAKMYGRD